MKITLSVKLERFPIANKFTISRGSKTEAAVVTVYLTDGNFLGRGECVPYARYGENVDGVMNLIQNVWKNCDDTISPRQIRDQINSAMTPGAARNAVDCALWDLEAKQSNKRVFELAQLAIPGPVETAYTISLDTPEQMFLNSQKQKSRPILKAKLGAKDDKDAERVIALRKGAPDSKLIIDANEGWGEEVLEKLLNVCFENKVALIEQPLKAGEDHFLTKVKKMVPICADESVHQSESLQRLVGLYDFVNIKLDKTGGLTEAIRTCQLARKLGFGIMIGCMVGTSLGMAPALLLAEKNDFVDLDGPLLLAEDRMPGLKIEGSTIYPAESSLWG